VTIGEANVKVEHPSEGVLQAYLDGEVLSEPREAVDRHLLACGACRDVLAQLDHLAQRTRETLARIDVASPPVEAARWKVRRARSSRRPPLYRRVAVAASLVLVAGAGWAAMGPGSPFRRVAVVDEALSTAAEAPPAEQAVELSAAPEPRGVAVPPEEGSVSIVFEGVGAGASVVVYVVDGDRATVTAPPASEFEAGEGSARVVVTEPAAELVVELPRTLLAAEIRVNDGVVYLSVDGEVSYPGPVPVPVEGGVRFPVEAP
jgi:hypothetical protein